MPFTPLRAGPVWRRSPDAGPKENETAFSRLVFEILSRPLSQSAMHQGRAGAYFFFSQPRELDKHAQATRPPCFSEAGYCSSVCYDSTGECRPKMADRPDRMRNGRACRVLRDAVCTNKLSAASRRPTGARGVSSSTNAISRGFTRKRLPSSPRVSCASSRKSVSASPSSKR